MEPIEDIFHQKTDYKKIILRFFHYKYYFIISVVFFLSLAFVKNKLAVRTYTNWTTLLIKQETRNSFLSSEELLSSGLFSGIDNIENEIAKLMSYTIVNQAVKDMGVEVSYYVEENLIPFDFLTFNRETDLYDISPIKVIIDPNSRQPVDIKFHVTIINDSVFKLKVLDYKVSYYDFIINEVAGVMDSVYIDGIYHFGEEISGENYRFSIYLTENFDPYYLAGKDLYFKINNLISLSIQYISNLSVSPTSTTSSVVLVRLNGSNPANITDFLNTFTNVYLEKSLERKNIQAFNTVKFIDSRISDISDSLAFAENRLQNFRSRNQVMDLSFQGEQLYSRMEALENERAQIIVQQKYYEYINEYFNTNSDVSDLVAPSAMGIEDPVLSGLIGDMLNLNNQRLNYIKSNPKNLFIKDLDIQIENLKSTILENIKYNYNKLELNKQDLESRISQLTAQLSFLPKTERELFGMERKFKLNDAIYTFLLQKRAEAQIARASNTSDYEVIDPARNFQSTITSPNTTMNYLIAMFLGLFFPFAFILAKDFLNNKITDITDIEKITSFPIIGQIFHNKSKSNTIIHDYPKSILADSFRSVRTNLQFYSKGIDKMVILITSSMSGEGKSFCSINIASVYALLEKKAILLGFDLRRPAIYSDFGLNNDKGISSFLIKQCELHEIIQKTSIENLDLITAGPIPPNPVELIASERTKLLLDELKKKYDYIIIDSAPIGAVTDSFLLFNYTDVNIFIIRNNYTVKDLLKANIKSINDKKFNNVTVVINDIDLKKTIYSYSYKSKYYTNKESKKKLRGLVKNDTKTGASKI